MCDTSKPPRAARARRPGRLARFASGIRTRAARVWHVLTGGHGPVIEVLVADAPRRRGIERELRGQVRHLRRALGADLPVDAILVQQVLPDASAQQDRAGCTRATTRADGRKRTLMVLALRANGRRLSTDEILAALALQAMALLGEAGATELHSITFPSSQPTAEAKLASAGADGVQRPAPRKVERRAMVELIHGTAPIASTPHTNGQETAPLPGA
jgi:hypothetical protein